MAADISLPDTLSSFTEATESASSGLPDAPALLPPENGITLLDAKNELFLSYLQALALRNLNVIRSLKDGADLTATRKLSDELTKRLVEHRVYLERGVRPLEQKIKYQVDKVVKAADDEERVSAQKSAGGERANGRAGKGEDSASEDSNEDNSDGDSDSDSDGGSEVDELSHRANLAGFAQPKATDREAPRRAKGREDGMYRPPRISATAMPTTTETRERRERRPGRSATLDEYVSTELSSAPLAEPSIGSTITGGGRRHKDARQLAKERERREYEETNFVRLPKESRTELRKQQKGGDRGGGFGGEEWRGIDDGLDRIGDLTKRKKGTVLDKSRKRRAVEDGPRADGAVGQAFDIKKRRVEKKMNRR